MAQGKDLGVQGCKPNVPIIQRHRHGAGSAEGGPDEGAAAAAAVGGELADGTAVPEHVEIAFLRYLLKVSIQWVGLKDMVLVFNPSNSKHLSFWSEKVPDELALNSFGLGPFMKKIFRVLSYGGLMSSWACGGYPKF